MHVTQKGSEETDDGARRYDKAGVPEGPIEQAVFTVKAIFINLYTCRRSAPLPIADFELHITKTNTKHKVKHKHKDKDKHKDKHKLETILINIPICRDSAPLPIADFHLHIITSDPTEIFAFFQLHLPRRNAFDTYSGICSQ